MRIGRLVAVLYVLPSLLFGICWFIAMSALYYVGVPDGLVVRLPIIFIAVVATAVGLLFGLCVAVPLGLFQFYRVQRVAGTSAPFDISPIQTRTLELALDLPAAFRLCALALGNLPAEITEKNETTGVLKARMKSTRISLGEDITITLTSNHANTHLTIISRPRYRTTLLDFGKNYENVEKILTYLKSHP
jgi:hypothetical protein